MVYDIDFPVSETWARFYLEKGLSVDPAMIRYETRGRGSTQEDLLPLVFYNQIVELLNRILLELQRRMPEPKEKARGDLPKWRFIEPQQGTQQSIGE